MEHLIILLNIMQHCCISLISTLMWCVCCYCVSFVMSKLCRYKMTNRSELVFTFFLYLLYVRLITGHFFHFFVFCWYLMSWMTVFAIKLRHPVVMFVTRSSYMMSFNLPTRPAWQHLEEWIVQSSPCCPHSGMTLTLRSTFSPTIKSAIVWPSTSWSAAAETVTWSS